MLAGLSDRRATPSSVHCAHRSTATTRNDQIVSRGHVTSPNKLQASMPAMSSRGEQSRARAICASALLTLTIKPPMPCGLTCGIMRMRPLGATRRHWVIRSVVKSCTCWLVLAGKSKAHASPPGHFVMNARWAPVVGTGHCTHTTS